MGRLRGERDHCKMCAIPTFTEEDAKRPHRERDTLVGEHTTIINRIKATLARLGIRSFNPKLKKAPEPLEHLRKPEGEPIPPNTLAELKRDMERKQLVAEQIKQIEKTRLEQLKEAPKAGPTDGPRSDAGNRHWHRDGGHAGQGDPVAQPARPPRRGALRRASCSCARVCATGVSWGVYFTPKRGLWSRRGTSVGPRPVNGKRLGANFSGCRHQERSGRSCCSPARGFLELCPPPIGPLNERPARPPPGPAPLPDDCTWRRRARGARNWACGRASAPHLNVSCKLEADVSHTVAMCQVRSSRYRDDHNRRNRERWSGYRAAGSTRV